jgi:DNA-binding PadR family transcriptional regulator
MTTFQIQDTPASNPWTVTLAVLASLEHEILDTQKEGLLKRWEFGHELLKKRTTYKGQLCVPRQLMTLTVKQCRISQPEITKRIRFAERYPTRKEASNAVTTYPSWHQMVKEGLVDKKRTPKARAKKVVHSLAWTLKRLKQEVAKAQTHHATLTREQITDVEDLLKSLQQLLEQVDQNDDAKAQRKIS